MNIIAEKVLSSAPYRPRGKSEVDEESLHIFGMAALLLVAALSPQKPSPATSARRLPPCPRLCKRGIRAAAQTGQCRWALPLAETGRSFHLLAVFRAKAGGPRSRLLQLPDALFDQVEQGVVCVLRMLSLSIRVARL